MIAKTQRRNDTDDPLIAPGRFYTLWQVDQHDRDICMTFQRLPDLPAGRGTSSVVLGSVCGRDMLRT